MYLFLAKTNSPTSSMPNQANSASSSTATASPNSQHNGSNSSSISCHPFQNNDIQVSKSPASPNSQPSRTAIAKQHSNSATTSHLNLQPMNTQGCTQLAPQNSQPSQAHQQSSSSVSSSSYETGLYLMYKGLHLC